jgi:hypothetical protein
LEEKEKKRKHSESRGKVCLPIQDEGHTGILYSICATFQNAKFFFRNTYVSENLLIHLLIYKLQN